MWEGHFSPDPLGSSNFRASKQLKTAKNGLFGQFLTIWHSVDQFFGWNPLDLTQKSLTIYGGRYFKSRTCWIQPYFCLKTAQNGPKWPILAVFAYFTFFGPIFWLEPTWSHPKSLTIYWGRYFKSRSNWIEPYFGLKTAQKGPKWPILADLELL